MTDWRDFYKDIELTEEEIEAAIFEGKVKKYFHETHKEYWQEQESKGKHKGKQLPDMRNYRKD